LGKLREYVGCIHIHTTASDGVGSVDFVMTADHCTRIEKDEEGWHEGVLVIGGEEAGKYKGHLLVYGVDKVFGEGVEIEEVMDEIQKGNGVAFIAHPFSRTNFFFMIKGYPWRRWEIERFCGIEVWSYMYDWLGKTHWGNVIYHLAYPDRVLRGPDRKTLGMWDRLCEKRRITGIAGLDVHGMRVWGLELMGYEQLFAGLRNHLLCNELTGNAGQDVEIILDTLKEGRLFFALDSLADSYGFRFWFEGGGGKVLMGEEVPFRQGKICICAPCEAEFVIRRNGEVFWKERGREAEVRLKERGVYRVEGRIDGKAWLFTNPIYLR